MKNLTTGYRRSKRAISQELEDEMYSLLMVMSGNAVAKKLNLNRVTVSRYTKKFGLDKANQFNY